MKLVKKISLLLCCCIALSSMATACNENDPGESSGSAPSSNTESSQSGSDDDSEEEEEEGGGRITNVDVFLGLLASRLQKMEAADLTFSVTNNGLLETGALASNTVWKMFSGNARISKRGESFDAQISLSVSSLENPTQLEEKDYYFIDGYVYEYFEDTNTYNKYNQSLDEVLGNFVNSVTQGAYTPESLLSLLLGGGMLEGATTLTYQDLKDELDGYVVLDSDVLEDNTGMWITFDATEKSDELFDFLRTVDKATTFGEIFDFALKQISPELTTEKVLEELYPRGRDTVSELVADLDAKSQEETGKTLQENLDTLLKNEVVKELVQSIFKEENENLANVILSFNINDFLKENSTIEDDDGNYIKYGDLDLNRLSKVLVQKLIDALGEDNEMLEDLGLLGSNMNWGLLLGAVEMILDMKPFENLEEDSAFFKLLEQAQMLEVTKTDGKLEVTLGKTDVEKIGLSGNLSGNRVSGDTTAGAGGQAQVEISNFSDYAVEITLPENATLNEIIYSACAECKEKKESVIYRENEQRYLCDECATPDDTDVV